jgi:hypothetical protein
VLARVYCFHVVAVCRTVHMLGYEPWIHAFDPCLVQRIALGIWLEI